MANEVSTTSKKHMRPKIKAAVTLGRRGGKAENAELTEEQQNAVMADLRKGDRFLAAFRGEGFEAFCKGGALGRIRTSGPRNRNPMLYPAELRARESFQCAGRQPKRLTRSARD
jgi:hypothetical protein